MKKQLLSLALLAGMLAGCGGSGGSAPTAALPNQLLGISTVGNRLFILPESASLEPGQLQGFQCGYNGRAAICNWRVVEGQNAGYIDNNGQYTGGEALGTWHIEATLASDPSKVTSIPVTISMPPSPPPPPPPTKWVSAYYATYHWSKDFSQKPEKIDYSTMTHLMIAHVFPRSSGIVEFDGEGADPNVGPFYPQSIQDGLITRAHNAGVKAIMMLGGSGDAVANAYSTATAPALRATFITNIVDYMVAHDYDGVDIDWEPIAWSDTDVANLKLFLRDLRIAANARPRYQAKPVILTFPAGNLNMNYQQAPLWTAEIAALVDQFNIMTYNMAWDSTGWSSTHFSPIYGHTGNHAMDVQSTLQSYRTAGIPAAKLGVGIGLYGMSYENTAMYQLPVNNWQHDDNLWAYSRLYQMGYLSNGNYTFDEVAKGGYRLYPGGFQPSGRPRTNLLAYETPRGIAEKAKFVRDNNYGGAIVWTINFGTEDRDNNPMMQAVKSAFLTTP